MTRKYLVTEDELKSASVNAEGILTFTRDNGEVIHAGPVRGGVGSEQVARIVAVAEGAPLPTLFDGDLVVRYAAMGDQVLTEFTGQELGEQPENLEIRWGNRVVATDLVPAGASRPVTARIDAGTTLQIEPTVNASPYMDGAEVLFRYWNSGASRNSPIVTFGFETDGSGNRTAMFGIQATVSSGTLRIAPFLRTAPDDSNVYIAPVDTGIVNPDGDWLRIRARLEGSTVHGKVWHDNATEPADWQMSYTDTRFADIARTIGVGRTSYQGAQHLDWISWATGSKEAVTP